MRILDSHHLLGREFHHSKHSSPALAFCHFPNSLLDYHIKLWIFHWMYRTLGLFARHLSSTLCLGRFQSGASRWV
ncbi:hypothetical protein Q8A67_021706 [Cirrhinus molitorella]|uniref:Uncharacterized protein n=1 Tax=Cirrhinus molitorella TaxID=172907 RepID=A0AA88P7H6_9TELE|nr:hypothetical protein Q8A67_021706 [Cirrhinus molitorella]